MDVFFCIAVDARESFYGDVVCDAHWYVASRGGLAGSIHKTETQMLFKFVWERSYVLELWSCRESDVQCI